MHTRCAASSRPGNPLGRRSGARPSSSGHARAVKRQTGYAPQVQGRRPHLGRADPGQHQPRSELGPGALRLRWLRRGARDRASGRRAPDAAARESGDGGGGRRRDRALLPAPIGRRWRQLGVLVHRGVRPRQHHPLRRTGDGATPGRKAGLPDEDQPQAEPAGQPVVHPVRRRWDHLEPPEEDRALGLPGRRPPARGRTGAGGVWLQEGAGACADASPRTARPGRSRASSRPGGGVPKRSAAAAPDPPGHPDLRAVLAHRIPTLVSSRTGRSSPPITSTATTSGLSTWCARFRL
jgi:hypothetical protein